ncbi:TetR/AcrR family transcriptional regulator [Yoonia sp. BS5-3]|uniref:TetR/AcrR family transcriptional regulator n=1 Tax=Yoonia phaeophyticola TaxID=3137369 RepID=A0ABZ2V8F0_9RHOB
MPAPKREHLLQTAESLFSKEGFKGISVDRLINEAGVAKMTLYKGFDSKDALICETLRRRANRLEALVARVIQHAGADPQTRLLSCFDAMDIWATRDDFNGCYFINALGEFGEEDHEVADIVRSYKNSFLKQLQALCEDCHVPEPETTAQNILMLIDGATVTRMTLGDTASYQRAKTLAAGLLPQADQAQKS